MFAENLRPIAVVKQTIVLLHHNRSPISSAEIES